MEGTKRTDQAACVRQKKLRIPFEKLDLAVKDPSKWKKYELEVNHRHLKKTGNKPELVCRVKEHMRAADH